MDLTYGRKKLTSAGTGGRRGTAQMLAFCADTESPRTSNCSPPPA